MGHRLVFSSLLLLLLLGECIRSCYNNNYFQCITLLNLPLHSNDFLCSFLLISSQIANLFNVVAKVVFDVLVVVLTAYRTGRLAFQSRQANISGSLSFILLRDGEFYKNDTPHTESYTDVLSMMRNALLRVCPHH